jgi:hypothetical protein
MRMKPKIAREYMRFVLHYRGPLMANGRPEHKHDLRRRFHLQLKQLWDQRPLNEIKDVLLYAQGAHSVYNVIRPLGPFTFAPLVSGKMCAVAELSITLLRPEPPGRLITQHGDIDNRLKTLFDSLTIPIHANQIEGYIPGDGEDPFFCLLEDDNLVTAVSVRTEQLLEPDNTTPSLVEVLIAVRTRVTREVWGNTIFA